MNFLKPSVFTCQTPWPVDAQRLRATGTSEGRWHGFTLRAWTRPSNLYISPAKGLPLLAPGGVTTEPVSEGRRAATPVSTGIKVEVGVGLGPLAVCVTDGRRNCAWLHPIELAPGTWRRQHFVALLFSYRIWIESAVLTRHIRGKTDLTETICINCDVLEWNDTSFKFCGTYNLVVTVAWFCLKYVHVTFMEHWLQCYYCY